MWINLILLFLYVSHSDGYKPHTKIGEGYSCPKSKHSYMVALITNAKNGSIQFIGGGTLLNELWVLTAAVHMYNYHDVKLYTVVAGIRSLAEMKSKSKQMQQSLVELAHISSDLITDALDIALLKLKKPIYKSKTVSYVELATEKNNLQGKKLENICAKATVVGYGNKKDDNPIFNGLYCAEVPVISKEHCNEELPYFILPHQLACFFQPKIYVCYGDVGGPVMCDGVQYGIMSGGYSCATKNPSIFTRVDKYESFIKSKLKADRYAKESKSCSNNFQNYYILIFSVIFYQISNYKIC